MYIYCIWCCKKFWVDINLFLSYTCRKGTLKISQFKVLNLNLKKKSWPEHTNEVVAVAYFLWFHWLSSGHMIYFLSSSDLMHCFQSFLHVFCLLYRTRVILDKKMAPSSVFITGGSRGVGLELVKQYLDLASPPTFIFAGYRTMSDELKELCEANPSLVVPVKIDLGDFGGFPAVVKQAGD